MLWMCLGVFGFALAMNMEFRKLGCHWRRWLGGIYSLQPLPSHWLFLLAMGTPDSPVVHRIGTVHCPVRATSPRPLGFGVVDRYSCLSYSCTRQSSGTPDMSGAFWLRSLTSDFTMLFYSRPLAPGYYCSVGRPDMSGAHRTVRWIIAERALKKPESGEFVWCLAWCTGHCLVRHLLAHSQVLCSKFIWVSNWISFLVCVEPYAPEINDI
jgi:hypothetical protein